MAGTGMEAFLAQRRAAEDKVRAEQDAALDAVRKACDAERKRLAEQTPGDAGNAYA